MDSVPSQRGIVLLNLVSLVFVVGGGGEVLVFLEVCSFRAPSRFSASVVLLESQSCIPASKDFWKRLWKIKLA